MHSNDAFETSPLSVAKERRPNCSSKIKENAINRLLNRINGLFIYIPCTADEEFKNFNLFFFYLLLNV